MNTRLLASAIAAVLLPAAFAQAATAPKPPVMAASDFRTVDPQNLLVVDTDRGRFIVEMYPEVAPQSVARVKTLAKAKFYDGLIFHRVIEGFMAQGGDPKGDGSGGSDMGPVPAEFVARRGPDMPYVQALPGAGREDGFVKALPIRTQSSDLMVMMADGKVPAWALWCDGVAGMARTGNDVNSASSQIFFMRGFQDQLEHNYTAWGRVLVGEEVVKQLNIGEPPPHLEHMKTVRVMADLPPAEQTKVQVLDTASPGFKALLAYDKAQAGDSFTVCDVNLPTR